MSIKGAYIYFQEAGTHTVTTSILDITDQLQTSADVYEKQVTVLTPGFYPMVIDLNELPNGGSAWMLSERFPDTISEEETAFEFTISVQCDRRGNFYEMFRVTDVSMKRITRKAVQFNWSCMAFTLIIKYGN